MSSSSSKEWETYLESWSLLGKISEIERNVQRSTPNRSQALGPFMEWMTGHDVQMGSVELAELPLYGCCIKATQLVRKDEMLFSIPEKLMMSTQTAVSSPIGS